MKVLIDAGHGIDTPGKRSPDGRFREYKWNREVADILLDNLISRGVDAELVVKETNDISLKTRAMRVNKVCTALGANNVILVSIHANAAGNEANGCRHKVGLATPPRASQGRTNSPSASTIGLRTPSG